MTDNMILKLTAYDPAGVELGSTQPINYTNLDMTEGRRTIRHLLTIGKYEYWVKLDGEIIDQLEDNESNISRK